MTDSINHNEPRLLDPKIAADNAARLFEIAQDVFSNFPAHVRRANMLTDITALTSRSLRMPEEDPKRGDA